MKIRVRFGFKLSWPIANAAIAVIYITQDQFSAGETIIRSLRLWLSTVGHKSVAEKIVFEAS